MLPCIAYSYFLNSTVHSHTSVTLSRSSVRNVLSRLPALSNIKTCHASKNFPKSCTGCGERTQHEKLESSLSSLEQARRSFTDIRSSSETSRRLRRRRLVTLCLYAYCPSGKIAQCTWDAREVGDCISFSVASVLFNI